MVGNSELVIFLDHAAWDVGSSPTQPANQSPLVIPLSISSGHEGILKTGSTLALHFYNVEQKEQSLFHKSPLVVVPEDSNVKYSEMFHGMLQTLQFRSILGKFNFVNAGSHSIKTNFNHIAMFEPQWGFSSCTDTLGPVASQKNLKGWILSLLTFR